MGVQENKEKNKQHWLILKLLLSGKSVMLQPQNSFQETGKLM